MGKKGNSKNSKKKLTKKEKKAQNHLKLVHNKQSNKEVGNKDSNNDYHKKVA